MKKRFTTGATLIAWTLAIPCAQAGVQQASRGFVEDGTWSLLGRSVYDRRDYRNGATSNGARNAFKPRAARNDRAEEWGAGLIGQFSSGYSRGTVGFGLDAHLYQGLTLDSGGGRAGKARLLALDNDGNPQDSYARAGAAAKLRLSGSELKVGEQRVKTPIFAASDSRLLPETASGWFVDSREWSNLRLLGGHFTAAADRNASSNGNELVVNYADPSFDKGNSFDFVGAAYSGIPGLSMSLYGGRYEDNWRTHYLGMGYERALGAGRSLDLDLQVYHSRDYGQALAGEVDNTTWSLMARYRLDAQALAIGYQQVAGDTPFDYVSRGAIWLDNAMQLSDFNGPHERSWQARYEYDLGSLVTPGLSFSVAYTRGSDIDGSRVDPHGAYAWLGYGVDGKHWERDLTLRYAVPRGRAKGLTLLLQHDVHRNNAAQAELDSDQLRLAVEYPLSGRL